MNSSKTGRKERLNIMKKGSSKVRQQKRLKEWKNEKKEERKIDWFIKTIERNHWKQGKKKYDNKFILMTLTDI